MRCPHCNKEIPPVVPDRFEEWYGIYPRKMARGQALRAYKHALSKVGPDLLMERTKAYRDYAAKHVEKQFIPLPSTWLNGERWLDAVLATMAITAVRVPLDPLHPSWKFFEGHLQKALGYPKMISWFGGSELSGDGKPWRITVDKALKRDWILKNYAVTLYNILGEFEVIVR